MAKQAEAFSKGAGLRHHADVSAGPPDPGTDQALRIFPYFFKKIGPTPTSFSFIFGLLKQTIQFLQQINVKKCYVNPVYGAGIRTHNLFTSWL